MEWRDERGHARRVWVYLAEAEALRERIEALRGGVTGVRVSTDEEAAAVDEVEMVEGEAEGLPRRAG